MHSMRGGGRSAGRMNRHISIVEGFHPYVHLPKEVEEKGLIHRIAVIFHTAREEVDYMFFDFPLFFEFIQTIGQSLTSEMIKVKDDTKGRHSFRDYIDSQLRIGPEDRFPPKEIYFYKKSEIQCFLATELWVYAGGPQPYSDSYTFSIYSKDKLGDLLLEPFKKIFKGHWSGELIFGSNDLPKNWWKKIRLKQK